MRTMNLLTSLGTKFYGEMMHLAIEKSYEARMEDVRDILFAVFQMDLSDDHLCQELLNTYKPLFDKYEPDMSAIRRSQIKQLYGEGG
mmetsp:Transcript_6976/g.16286  ORF Transcript_6976/g.16286 Transcript_6976/m.16286 type:complete len:87 (-) Transcript_6976:47-307(-)